MNEQKKYIGGKMKHKYSDRRIVITKTSFLNSQINEKQQKILEELARNPKILQFPFRKYIKKERNIGMVLSTGQYSIEERLEESKKFYKTHAHASLLNGVLRNEFFQLDIEIKLEEYRQRNFNELPSRFDCIFGNLLFEYDKEENKEETKKKVFELKIEHISNIAAFNIYNVTDLYNGYPLTDENLKNYWQAKGMIDSKSIGGNAEILIQGSGVLIELEY